MAEDANANIRIGVDTSDAISSVKNLQRQIALLNAQIATGSKTAATKAATLNQELVNSINATGKFSASMTNIKSSTEAFTTALEKNKLSMGQYFRYSMGSTRTFGNFFKKEFNTIQKVAVERVKDLQTQYISLGRDANGALKAIKIRPLALDMQDLTTKTMVTAQKMQLMNQLMKQGSTQLLNWGKNTQWAGRQLMVGFTIPLTMFATAAAKSFMDIEKQIIKIQRVYGDFSTTVEETKAMTDQIKTLANEYTKYGVAVADTLNLAAEAAAAGKTGQELLSQISEATRLAVLGNVEQTQALETTMSITNAFGVAAEDLAGKIDFLNAVENQSVTSIEDLTEAIPKAGPVVQQLGGDVEDLAFFLTAMKEGGINASEGANALKSGLASLINPTGKAKEMLAGFGINIEKIVQSNKGDVKGLVIDFASALDTLDPLARAQAIEQLFGKFQFSRLSTLFQNVIKDGTQAQRVLELSTATTQELAILSKRELGKIEQTTTYKFEKAFADFQAAIAPVGEEFLKLITPVIEFGTKLLQQFNNMDAGVKQFIVGLTVVLGGVFPALLMTVGLFANGIANILKLVSAVSMMFRKTSGDAGILGNQFSYMTQTELQAAAAAASLDQVHSKLRQTFTSERAAVDALTTAYQRNIAAQKGAMGGGATGRRPKPATGYANGVVSVPGPKGAGDVVPAMLSPGESVIPAAMTKKYAPLIQGMVAGKIPGFESGVFNVFSNATGFLSQKTNKQLTAEGAGSGVDAKALASEIKSIGGGKGAFASPIIRQIVTQMGLATTEKDIQKLMSGPQGKEIRALAQNITGGIAGAVVQQGGRISDSDLARISEAEVKKATTGTRFAKAAQTVMTRKTNFAQEGVGNRKSLIAGMPWYGAGATQRKRDVAMGRGITGNESFTDAGLARAHLTQMKKMTSAEIKQYLTQNKLTPSDSVLRLIDAKESQEAKASATKAKAAVKKTSAAQAAKNSRSTVTKSGSQYFSTDPTTGKKTRLSNAAGQQAMAAEEKRQARNAAQRERRAQAKLTANNTPAPRRTFGKRAAGIGGKIASGVRGMGGMGLGMGVSMAGGAMAMVPGLEGVGSALAMIGPLFMMLPAPIAAVAAGLAGLVGIVMSANAAMEKQRKEAIAFGDTLVMSTGAVQQISEDLGTVTVSQAAQEAQAALITKTSSAALSEGQQYFRETESGKEILGAAKTAATKLTDQEFIDSIANNFAYAVAQGAMSAQQAQDYVAALSVELGRSDLAVKLKAQVTSIIGPDGKDLYNNPLKVTTDIARTSMNLAGITPETTVAPTEIQGLQTSGNYGTVDTTGNQSSASALLNAYSQSVGGADIIDATYGQQIQALIDKQSQLSAGSAAYKQLETEISDIQTRRISDLQSNRDLQSEIYTKLEQQRTILGADEFSKIVEVKITDSYGEEGTTFIEQLNKFNGSEDFKIGIKAVLASGGMNLQTAQGLLDTALKNKSLETIYTVTLKEQGLQAAINKSNALRRILQDAQNGFRITADNADRILRNAGTIQPYTPAPITGGGGGGGGGNGGDGGGSGGGGGTPEDSILKDLKDKQDKAQKALNVIALKEDAINKKYDKRKKALEDIAKINANIADQQKGQLDLADALARGDIASAAKAIQTERARATQYAEEQQQKALEAKRQAELDGIIVNGKTKEAYEAEIAKLNLKIAERELALALGAKSSGGSGGGSGSGSGSSSGSSSSSTGSTNTNSGGTGNSKPPKPAAKKGFRWEFNQKDGWYPLPVPKPGSPSGVGEALAWDYAKEKWYVQKVAKPSGPKSWTWDNAKDVWKVAPNTPGGYYGGYSMGGKVAQRYLALGGKTLGSDTIPAMLTPGEFVVKRPAVQGFGVKNLEAINNGSASGLGSVYTYNVSVNVSSTSDANEIARTVIGKIKEVDRHRIRGVGQ